MARTPVSAAEAIKALSDVDHFMAHTKMNNVSRADIVAVQNKTAAVFSALESMRMLEEQVLTLSKLVPTPPEGAD